MTEFLVRRFVRRYEHTEDPAVRTAYGNLAGAVGIACNALLCAAKLLVGTLFGSISVTADAVNNLSDASSSIITLVGFKLSAKPADKEHPYGHARIEYLAGLAVSVLIIVIGFELARTSLDKILHPTPVAFSWLTVAVLVGSIGVKLWMAVFILYSGIGLIKETVDPLLGEAPSEELTQYIARKVLSYEGVLGTHDLMVHDYGPGRCFASVHVEMAAEKDVLESHDIIDNIERDFHDNDNIHLVIHYDPIQTGDRAVGTLRTWMEGQLQTISPQLSMHDFRTVRGPTHTNLIFDVVVPAGFSLGDEALRARIQQLAQQKNTEEMKYYTVVTVDHSYAPYHQDEALQK